MKVLAIMKEISPLLLEVALFCVPSHVQVLPVLQE